MNWNAIRRRVVVAGAVGVTVAGLFGFGGRAFADQHTAGAPALSSRPGAPYTVYLDVAGFNYTGAWSSDELGLPGSTPAIGDVAASGTFNSAQVAEIKNVWSRMAQSYIGFNVNVTTVDPAVAAGQAATDLARQNFYDNQPNLMHTVIGSQVRGGPLVSATNPQGKWYSTEADGVSGLGVVAGVTGATGNGGHTNWMFTEAQQGPGFINGNYIGAIAAHENGHAFGLYHQGDWTANTLVNEYSFGDAAGTPTTPGTYVPIMGNADGLQRVVWRVGDTDQADNNGPVRVPINDIQSMLATNNVSNGRVGTANLHLVNDGIGHTRATATVLPLTGTSVNSILAQGVIVPASESSPNPTGAANYTHDWFSFNSNGAPITLTATNGTEFLVPGVADGVGTLRSTLTIVNAAGTVVATGTEAVDTLSETFTGTLPAGTYFVDVASFGGHPQNAPAFNAATYFDSGAFFLSGTGFAPVPEPAGFAILAVGVAGILVRRRRPG